MAIENVRLTTSQTDVLTVPANQTYAITNILVCNTDLTDEASFDMHFIKSGQPLDNKTTAVIRELVLPATETFTFDSERVILDAGDKLSFVAQPDVDSGLTDLAVTVSYLEL